MLSEPHRTQFSLLNFHRQLLLQNVLDVLEFTIDSSNCFGVSSVFTQRVTLMQFCDNN